MDDLLGGQVVAVRGFGETGLAAAERQAFLEEATAGGAVDGAVDAAAAVEECWEMN